MTREDTQKLLATMQALYPNFNVSDKTATVTVWAALLEPYERPLIMKALQHFARTSTSGFAPTTGQLIDTAYSLCETDVVPEGKAWEMLMQATSKGIDSYKEEYEKLPKSLQIYLGSPWQLHIWASSSDFNESVERALFVKAYKGICDAEKKTFIANGMKQPQLIEKTEQFALEKSSSGNI